MTTFMTKRTIAKGGLVYTVGLVHDETPDLAYLKQRYQSDTPEDRKKYRKQDRERLAGYEAGRWFMVGVVCEVSIKTATNWAVPHVVARASVWGIESDSSDSFITETEEEQIAEADADLKATADALAEAMKPQEPHATGSHCPKCGEMSFKIDALFNGYVCVTLEENGDFDSVDESEPGDSEWTGPVECLGCGWNGILADLVSTAGVNDGE